MIQGDPRKGVGCHPTARPWGHGSPVAPVCLPVCLSLLACSRRMFIRYTLAAGRAERVSSPGIAEPVKRLKLSRVAPRLLTCHVVACVCEEGGVPPTLPVSATQATALMVTHRLPLSSEPPHHIMFWTQGHGGTPCVLAVPVVSGVLPLPIDEFHPQVCNRNARVRVACVHALLVRAPPGCHQECGSEAPEDGGRHAAWTVHFSVEIGPTQAQHSAHRAQEVVLFWGGGEIPQTTL